MFASPEPELKRNLQVSRVDCGVVAHGRATHCPMCIRISLEKFSPIADFMLAGPIIGLIMAPAAVRVCITERT